MIKNVLTLGHKGLEPCGQDRIYRSNRIILSYVFSRAAVADKHTKRPLKIIFVPRLTHASTSYLVSLLTYLLQSEMDFTTTRHQLEEKTFHMKVRGAGEAVEFVI